jgi:hypothetical protein
MDINKIHDDQHHTNQYYESTKLTELTDELTTLQCDPPLYFLLGQLAQSHAPGAQEQTSPQLLISHYLDKGGGEVKR